MSGDRQRPASATACSEANLRRAKHFWMLWRSLPHSETYDHQCNVMLGELLDQVGKDALRGASDQRCGEGNVDKTTCMLVRGHDGNHYDGIGYWAGLRPSNAQVHCETCLCADAPAPTPNESEAGPPGCLMDEPAVIRRRCDVPGCPVHDSAPCAPAAPRTSQFTGGLLTDKDKKGNRPLVSSDAQDDEACLHDGPWRSDGSCLICNATAVAPWHRATTRDAPALPQRQAWHAFLEVFNRCWCGSAREGTAGWAIEHVRCIPDLPCSEAAKPAWHECQCLRIGGVHSDWCSAAAPRTADDQPDVYERVTKDEWRGLAEMLLATKASELNLADIRQRFGLDRERAQPETSESGEGPARVSNAAIDQPSKPDTAAADRPEAPKRESVPYSPARNASVESWGCVHGYTMPHADTLCPHCCPLAWRSGTTYSRDEHVAALEAMEDSAMSCAAHLIAKWLRRYADEHSGSHPANAGYIACNAAASAIERGEWKK